MWAGEMICEIGRREPDYIPRNNHSIQLYHTVSLKVICLQRS
jgi:hypothetical protein